MNEIAVLGSAANLCARLSSAAAAGEILVSQEAAELAGIGMQAEGLERRALGLKGISAKVSVQVITVCITENVQNTENRNPLFVAKA